MLLQYDAGLFLTFLLYLFVLVSLAVSLSVWEGRSISLCWKISWISVCLESWSLGPARHFSLLSPDWRQNCGVFLMCTFTRDCVATNWPYGDPVRMSSTYVQSEAEERAKIAIFAAFDEKPPESGFLKTYSVTNCFKIESDKG